MSFIGKIKIKKIFSTLSYLTILFIFIFQHTLVLLAAAPTVMTDGTSNITKTSAYLYGSTMNDGGQTITEEGFNYGLTASYGSTLVGSETGIYLEDLSFGEFGSSNGQFETARAIDIDDSGNIYVSDAGSGRGSIQKFDSSGNFIIRYGTFGNGNGQLSSPTAIKVDSSGNIFVADTGNNRVQKLDSSGAYVFKITGSPNFFTFSGVSGVAVDSSGNIYISDGGHHLVEKYDSTGAHLSTYGSLLGPGTGNNEFNNPQGLFIDSSDNLYVADSGNDRVMKFNSAGVYQSHFGTAGTGNGQFDTPTSIDINSNGEIYVIDYLNYRIQKFNSSGTFLSSFGGYGTADNQFTSPFGLAITSSDQFWIADDYKVKNFKDGFYNASLSGLSCGTTYHYQAYSENIDGTSTSADATFSTLACEVPEPVTGTATSVTDTSVILDGLTPDNNSISATSRGFEYGLTTSYGQTVSESDGLFKFTFGSLGTGDGRFNSSGNSDRDSLGNIYVTDINNNRVQKFNSAGVYQSHFGTAGTGNGQFSLPSGIIIDSADNIFVADAGNNRVQKLDSSGAYIFKITGSPNFLTFSGVGGVAVDSLGNIYISDSGNHLVEKYDSTGIHLSTLGSLLGSGNGNNEFNTPQGLFIDSDDNLYIADSVNNRVMKFNSAGVYQSHFGTAGSGDGELSIPYGVAVDSSGNIFVVDTGNNRVQKFNGVTYDYISQFGISGSGDGEFSSPYGISIDESNNIFVTDTYNNRVQVFNEFYDLPVTGLSCGNTYHYRAFAINSDGTGYGDDETFDTTPCPSSGGGGGTSSSSTKLICTDPKALNYTDPSETGKVDNDRCRYPETHLSCDENFFLSRPVKYGANNNPDDVKLLEKYLNTYEGYELPVDGVYSKTDFNAVVKWQEKYYFDILKPWGISKGTGYVYVTSLRKIKEISDKDCAGMQNENKKNTCFIYVENVSKPRKGGMVLAVQKALKASGFLNGSVDGVFGKITEGAVKSFQKSKGINQTGIVGPLTGQELEKVDCTF